MKVIPLILKIFSKALYSTWIYYAPERILFDAGEGVSTSLTHKIYAIKYIFLTHGHVDHIAGLWGIVNARNNSMGDREKPIVVYYPKNNRAIEEWLNYIKKANSDLRYDLECVPVVPGEQIFVRQAGGFMRYVVPFRVKHTAQNNSVGYHVVEKRKRLKKEFRDLPQHEIARLSRERGSEVLSEMYEKKILTVSGDTVGIEPHEIEETELLLHECTFLKSSDRRMENHASLEEVLNITAKAKVKNLILYHISSRYSGRIERYLKKYKALMEENDIDVKYVDPDKIFSL